MERRSFIRYGKPFVGESSEREAAWSSSAVCTLVRREANRQARVACRDCSWGYRAFLPDEALGGPCGRSSVLSAAGGLPRCVGRIDRRAGDKPWGGRVVTEYWVLGWRVMRPTGQLQRAAVSVD